MFHANTHHQLQTEIKTLAPERDITVIGVTKYASLEDMHHAYDAGLRHFGENRVEIALPKIEHFRQQGLTDIHWHFIGHLQRKKVPKLGNHFAAIHSVDTTELADKLHQSADNLSITQSVFVQVNMANEPQKSGFAPCDLEAAIAHLHQHCPALHIKGLMTLLPKDCPHPQAHQWYSHLNALNHQFGFSHLSTGMTQDYAIALQHGATHIRIGRALFSSD